MFKLIITINDIEMLTINIFSINLNIIGTNLPKKQSSLPYIQVLIIMNCYLGLKNRLQVYLGVKLFLSRESLAVD